MTGIDQGIKRACPDAQDRSSWPRRALICCASCLLGTFIETLLSAEADSSAAPPTGPARQKQVNSRQWLPAP